MAATARSVEELEQRAHNAAGIVEAMRELEQTEGWKILKKAFEFQRKTYYEKLSRDLMKGAEIDQRKLDYNRGGMDRLEELLEGPANAEKVFKSAVRSLEKAREGADSA